MRNLCEQNVKVKDLKTAENYVEIFLRMDLTVLTRLIFMRMIFLTTANYNSGDGDIISYVIKRANQRGL